MTDVPRFTVTIPAYNASATIAETIESVLAQTFTDWEMVIVDDGSTDDTRQVGLGYAAKDPRIRVISQENRGSGGAYNTAVAAARADLLVMLSADDLLLPEHLATFDPFVDANPDAAIFTSDGYYLYDDGSRELANLQSAWADRSSCGLIDLFHACFFGMGAVYRRAVYDAVGGFEEDIYAEDYLFWLMALAKGFRHRSIDTPLGIHRRNSVQKSADTVRMRQAQLRSVQEVLATGLLKPEEAAVAERTIAGLKRTILIRRTLVALLGRDGANRLIDLLRGRRTVPGGRGAEAGS